MVTGKWMFGRALGGGIVAGLIAGAVLSIYMAIGAVARGEDVWLGAKMAGAPFLGDAAMRPGFEPVAVTVGVLSHFLVSVGWGALFGLIGYGLSRPLTVVAGLAYGVVVWLGMFYVVLPLVGMSEVAAQVPIWAAVVEHLVFGLALALAFLPFQRRIALPRPRPAGGEPAAPGV